MTTGLDAARCSDCGAHHRYLGDYSSPLDLLCPACQDAHTAADTAQAHRDQMLHARLDRARQLYRREILNHAQPGTKAAIELNAQAIIKTLAGVLPLEPDASV